jgi:hypothetical protein
MLASSDIAARFAVACDLMQGGRADEARAAFLALLALAPDHVGALNNLGTLLYETGYRSAARTAYAEAVARHPDDPVGRVNLGNLLLGAGEFAAAHAEFEAALAAAPDHTEAHRGLAYCLDEAGDEVGAKHHRDAAFTGRALTVLPFRGAGTPLPLLILVAAKGGNIPTRFLIDDRVVAATVAVADYLDVTTPLPPHALVFNTIGDADLVPDAIAAAQRLIARTMAPVINRPERVAVTGRAEIAQRLGGIAGLRAPRIATVPRAELAADGAAALARRGIGFPVLVRALGFHTGRHFVRVDGPDDLAGAVAKLPGRSLVAIEYLDARGVDGRWRKYRAMMIDGRIYPLHLAVSDHWKVHYFMAGMADHAEDRAEEAAFLADMEAALGKPAVSALESVQKMLGLDYAGIDFGLDAQGHVLLFEANATMVVNPPEPDPRWDYRREPVQRILDAAKRMLIERAGWTLTGGAPK